MKTINVKLLLPAIAVLFLTGSCIENYTIRGNGIAESESRYIPSFEKVASSGSFEVHVSPGDEYDVVVNAETNLLPYIETDVRGNTLDIRVQPFHNVRNRLPMEVYITSPYLRTIKQSGSGTITTGYFEAEFVDISISGSGTVETAIDCHDIDANISGSGSVYLTGTANDANYKISGSGKIYAYELETVDCKATISGSGDIYTNVDRFLDATISGSGNVFYIGFPTIDSRISGSGKIIHED